MKFATLSILLISLAHEQGRKFGVNAFGISPASTKATRSLSSFRMSNDDSNDVNRMTEILKEEASNEATMKAAAEQMKNLKSEDIDRMVKEMENMNPFQQQALKAIGMDPEAMKQTMNMMKENPQMMESAQKLLSNMTPQQMMEQSRMAQERMKSMTPEQIAEANKAMSSIPKEQLDQAVDILSSQATSTSNIVDAEIETVDEGEAASTNAPMATGPGTSSDPKVIDSMFGVAEFMSEDPEKGGVTLSGFASLPVVQLLSGSAEEDLSMAELKECWASGSLGATRVDRVGFERVWKEVQDYFEDDIMGEARKEAKKQVSIKKKRGGASASKPSSPSPETTIGAGMTAEQLEAVNQQVKNMDDSDVSQVLKAMEQMDPAQEARLKSMGVDPSMMQKTAQMLQSNPMMRKAAQNMMQNMSPQDMLKMSQQAQEQMKNMTPEQAQQALKELEEKGKQQ